MLLQSHHATPVTQLAALGLRMGKQGRNSWQADGQAPWQQGQGQGSNSSSWAYWGGSWKAKPGKEDDAQPPANKFPQYSRTPLPQPGVAGDQEPGNMAIATAGMGHYMRDLQRALTTCRKADGRLRKLQEQRATKDLQWQQFQRDVKANYLAQKKQYQRDIETLAQDLTAAMEASRVAVAAVQSLAAGQEPVSQPACVVGPPQATQEAEDAWSQLMGASEGAHHPSSPEAPDSVLALALKEAHELARTTQAMQSMHLQTAPSPMRRVHVTPKRGTSAGAPLTVRRGAAPVYSGPLQEAPSPEMGQRLELSLQQLQQLQGSAPSSSDPHVPVSDPYQVPSPVPVHSPPAEPPRSATPHKSPGHKARAGVKDASKQAAAVAARPQVPRVPLSDRLQEKRDKLTAELPHAALSSADAARPPGAPSLTSPLPVQPTGPQTFLIDDDHGPSAAEVGTQSPGFGMME